MVICTARGPSLPPSLVQARPQGRLLANQISPLASAQSGDSGQSQGRGGPLPQADVLPRGQGPLSQGLAEPSWLCRCATPTIKSRLKTGALLAAFNQLMG